MSDVDLLQEVGIDAAKWAEKFCEIYPGCGEGMVIAWFANAMCVAEENQRSRDEKITIQALGLLSSVLASRAKAWDRGAPGWFPEPPEWLELWQQAWAVVTADEKAPDYQQLVESLA